jgi:hypothetical protein
MKTPLASLKLHSGASSAIQLLAILYINEVHLNFKLIEFVSHDRSDRSLFGKSPL